MWEPSVSLSNHKFASPKISLIFNFTEIVVSAPYENHGSGAIYILSGYEVYNTLMKTIDYKGIQLSDLKLTQRIHKESYRALGFSLQFVDDVDRNACDGENLNMF